MKPWDHTHAYHSILGNMRVSGVTLANFEGPAACGSIPASGAFALSNHPHAPDAFHPHFFSNVSLRLWLILGRIQYNPVFVYVMPVSH